MRKIEQAPDWREDEILNKGLKLFINTEFKSLIDKINDKYLYWDKVKYQKTPEKSDPKILWAAVKFSRSIHAKQLNFGKYHFSYNLTDFIQKGLHEFDSNIGGQLGAKLKVDSGALSKIENGKKKLDESLISKLD